MMIWSPKSVNIAMHHALHESSTFLREKKNQIIAVIKESLV